MCLAENLARSQTRMRCVKDVYGVLYLSFEELPAYLKQCFLYLASFPEDYKIDVETLSYYWAAEGIQRPMDFNGAAFKRLQMDT